MQISVTFGSVAASFSKLMITSKPSGEVLSQNQEKQPEKKEELSVKSETAAVSSDRYFHLL
jgi:hypothetical protein